MKEIERKFLVSFPDEYPFLSSLKNRTGEVLHISGMDYIEQLYLERRADLPEVRIRRTLHTDDEEAGYPSAEEASFVLTIKKPESSLVREEEEFSLAYIEPELWETMLKQYPAVRKHRATSVTEEGYELVIDYITEASEQCVLAEVEFPDERSAGMWKPYEWMVKEVTEDTKYKMRYMCVSNNMSPV